MTGDLCLWYRTYLPDCIHIGKDNKEFYAIRKFFSFDDFKKQPAARQCQYNDLPMRPLGWKSFKTAL